MNSQPSRYARKSVRFFSLLSALTVLSGISACSDEEEEIFVVEEASWYFGTWMEDGTSNTLILSETEITFSSGSSLQRYGNSFDWYDNGEDDATLACDYGAGARFQGTLDGIIPEDTMDMFYAICHNEQMYVRDPTRGIFATYTRQN